MGREEKIKHLENLMVKVERLRCNERDIENLRDLIHAEVRKEENDENPIKPYVFHLKQTIEKQLRRLMESRKRPENRISEMNECKDHFKQDLKVGLSFLR